MLCGLMGAVESLSVVSDRKVVNLDPMIFTLPSATGNFFSCNFKAKTPCYFDDLPYFKIPTSQRHIRSLRRMQRCVAGEMTNNSVWFDGCSRVIIGCE